MPRLPLFWPALAALLACSCASGSGSRPSASESAVPSPPARVSFVDYRNGMRFVLVNESHTDRVELYSRTSTDASTKVATDELMDELLEHLDQRGFDARALSGPAPADSTAWSQVIEVEDSAGTRHLGVGKLTTESERDAFHDCRAAFLYLYNNIFAAQSVDMMRFKKPGKRADR